jgi:hypothetical protein
MGMKRKKKLIYYKVHLLDCKLSLDMQTIFSCLGHVRFLGVQIEKQKIFGALFDLMGQHLKVTWIRPGIAIKRGLKPLDATTDLRTRFNWW